MGAGASVAILEAMTAEQVADYVGSIGPAYVEYKDMIVHEGISGLTLSSLSTEAEVHETLDMIGVKKKLHVKNLCSHLLRLIKASKAATATGAAPQGEAPAATDGPVDIEVKECVEQTPRAIMTQLFQIQGIKLDPQEIEFAVSKIKGVVGSGYGDGKTKYDCFINYRVASDADIAEKLFLYLKTEGIHAYLDRKCLKDGMKWKEGFLTGLRSSRCFVALISRAGLARVRDPAQSHKYDNVLLEYETALNVMAATANPKYICPVHIGEISNGGVLTKFCDFASSLYPDTLEAVEAPTASAKPTIAKATAATDDNEDEGYEENEPENEEGEPTGEHGSNHMLCPTCDEEMVERPDFEDMGGWYCDWPGHEGDTRVEGLGYACYSEECDWAVCPACWSDIQSNKASSEDAGASGLLQSANTISRYDAAYYCRVKEVTATSEADGGAKLMLSVSCRGDMSLGAIQDPSSSKLIIEVDGGSQEYVSCGQCSVLSKDAYEIAAILTFVVADASLVFEARVMFEFGTAGYSQVTLSIPGSTYEAPRSDVPFCANGHPMEKSTYAGGDYVGGYVCDACRDHKQGERWLCLQCCSDLCFECEPA